MTSARAKDFRDIVKPNGLRGHSELKRFEFVAGDYLAEVPEDLFTREVYVTESGVTIEFCEDNSEDLPDGW